MTVQDHVCVFAKHDGCNKEFVFAVPPWMSVHKGDVLLVETKDGRAIATATSNIIEGEDVEQVALRFGAYLPLKKVLQVCGPELQKYIRIKTIGEICDAIRIGTKI